LENWGLSTVNRYLTSRQFFFLKVPFKYVTKIAITFSFFIGFLLTLLIVIADIFIFNDLSVVFSSAKLVIMLLVINIVVIALEFWLLFYIGFQVVAVYILMIDKNQLLDNQVKVSLIRAVLELNEPSNQNFVLNPYRKKEKYYWVMLIFYKIKVILSNAIGKVVVRKLLSRSSFRLYAPLVSTVITGWWDAWVQSAVLKEARYRLSGRLYIIGYIKEVTSNKEIAPDYLETLIRLLAVRIDLFGSFNNNLDYFITEIECYFPNSISQLPDLFDINLLKTSYLKLSLLEQNSLSDVACHIIILKYNRLSSEEKNLLELFKIKNSMVSYQKEKYNSINNLIN
jgi:hypothetical protein